MTIKSTLICATAIAIALTSFDLRPAAAAPEGGPAIVKQNAGADEISAQRRKRRRGVNPAIPLAAFGADHGHDRWRRGGEQPARLLRAPTMRRGYYGRPAYGYYGPPAYHRGYQRRGTNSVAINARQPAARLLQPVGRLRRPARLSRPERERAGRDELRKRRGPERSGAAARRSARRWVAATELESCVLRSGGTGGAAVFVCRRGSPATCCVTNSLVNN